MMSLSIFLALLLCFFETSLTSASVDSEESHDVAYNDIISKYYITDPFFEIERTDAPQGNQVYISKINKEKMNIIMN